MKYKTLFFDLDGTLFDYEQGAFNALRSALLSFEIIDDFNLFYQKYREINLQLWELFEKKQISLDALKRMRFERFFQEFQLDQISPADMSERYLFHLSHQAILLDDPIPVLEYLCESYRLGIITNGIASVQRLRLRCADLDRFFQYCIISQEHDISKPDRRIFEIALEMSQTPSNMALYIGDSVTSDLRGANNAQIDFCWLNPRGERLPGNLMCKYCIRNISELFNIL